VVLAGEFDGHDLPDLVFFGDVDNIWNRVAAAVGGVDLDDFIMWNDVVDLPAT
jgi:hypothetical protein